MVKFGFVKIISGQSNGRIGRFVGWDENGVRAKVAFGYDNDILPYTNYRFYSVNSITNNISKQDLVDRYFDLVQALKAIDLRAHRQIRKYTADHTSVITECNTVRFLLQKAFDLKNLILKNKEKNIVLFSSKLDVLWINELALELELRGFHVAIINYEVSIDDLDSILQYALDFCDHYVFIEEYHKYEYQYIKKNLSSVYQSLSIIVNNQENSDYKNEYFYFGESFSDEFEESLNKLIERLENTEEYSLI